MNIKYFLFIFFIFKIINVNAQVPNQFSPGEIVSSSKVNANFAYLANMIGNDNVTAMMVCNASGVANDKFYYAFCYSTDNQIFEDNVGLATTYMYASSYYRSNTIQMLPDDHPERFNNCISLNNIFNNKWVIFDSIKEVNWIDNNNMRIFEKHIFFKLRSD